jgi:hypothetical protein
MTDRRFNEDEVAAIFAQATEAHQSHQRQLPSGEGMTLAELQEIGREVGIAPELVAMAAKSLDQLGQPTARKFLGLPIGVGRTIELDRRLSDAEWEQIVVDLRETFDARGSVKQEGSFRQWTNGNLQALVEPTPSGQRIRLRTMKGDSRALMIGGAGMLGVAAATWITAVLGGAGGAAIMSVGQLGLMGAGMFAFGALRLPGWARLRRKQMEELAGRLTHRPLLPPAPDPADER